MADEMNISKSTSTEEGASDARPTMLVFNGHTLITGSPTFTQINHCSNAHSAQNNTTNNHDNFLESKPTLTPSGLILFPARIPPGVSNRLSGSQYSPAQRETYYVVFRGKCTGVYFGYWDDVKRLTDYVSGSIYKAFKTHVEASDAYWSAKSNNEVKLIRNPGDEVICGPEEDAVQ